MHIFYADRVACCDPCLLDLSQSSDLALTPPGCGCGVSNDRCILGIWFGWRSVAPRNARARFFLLHLFFFHSVHFEDTSEACDLADSNRSLFIFMLSCINVNGAATEL